MAAGHSRPIGRTHRPGRIPIGSDRPRPLVPLAQLTKENRQRVQRARRSNRVGTQDPGRTPLRTRPRWWDQLTSAKTPRGLAFGTQPLLWTITRAVDVVLAQLPLLG